MYLITIIVVIEIQCIVFGLWWFPVSIAVGSPNLQRLTESHLVYVYSSASLFNYFAHDVETTWCQQFPLQ